MIIWSGEILSSERLTSCLQSITEAALNDESQLAIIFGTTFLVKNGSELWMRFISQLLSRGIRILGIFIFFIILIIYYFYPHFFINLFFIYIF